MAGNGTTKQRRIRNPRSVFYLFMIGLMIFVVVYLFYQSFDGLLEYPNGPSVKTLRDASNAYSAQSPRATICDTNGIPLIANVAVDQNGIVQTNADGSYLLYADLDEDEQAYYTPKRMIVSGQPGDGATDPICWSNLLPGWSEGLDSSYDDLLRIITVENGESGTMQVTLDSRLQQAAYAALSDRNRASAMVMDLTNGDVLAMASTPSYDFNSLANNAIPFMRYIDKEGNEYYNIDNAHDCVEDFYNRWKSAIRKDNGVKKLTDEGLNYEFDGSAFRKYRSELMNSLFLLKREDAEDMMKRWNERGDFPVRMEETQIDAYLDQCKEFCFVDALQKEIATDGEEPFVEPEDLGEGEAYIPFVKVRFTRDSEDVWYLRIAYGANNFVYADCLANGFDPNFSFANFNLVAAAPGSCFKIVTGAMLADLAPDSLRAEGANGTEIMLGCERQGKVVQSNGELEYPRPLPFSESYMDRGNYIKDLREALEYSSNQYFSMAALNLDLILKGEVKNTSFDALAGISDESTVNSARVLDRFYRDVFCINRTDLEIDFRPATSTVFRYFDDAEIKTVADSRDISRGTYREHYDENGDYAGAYFTDRLDFQSMLGETAYGMGEDMMTPVHMAMSIGKCLTGEMLLPNLLKSESGELHPCGEPFARTDTVEIMTSHLQTVFDHYAGDYKRIDHVDMKPQFPRLTFYAKTGTSSVAKKVKGTQGAYGMFAEVATDVYRTIEPSDDNPNGKYQQIWFVGAVEDNAGHLYSIVLRSYFEDTTHASQSYLLIKEFTEVVRALCDNGYLNTSNTERSE